MAKVISRDNFDRDGPRGDEKLEGESLEDGYAVWLAKSLNDHAGPNAQRFYLVVADDYELEQPWAS